MNMVGLFSMYPQISPPHREPDGDLNNLSKRAKDRLEIRGSLKRIKGFGNVGVDIFCNTAQHVWPNLAPFVDARSLKTAEQIGIGNNVETLWEHVQKHAAEMCRLCSALTKIRLEKKQKEFS